MALTIVGGRAAAQQAAASQLPKDIYSCAATPSRRTLAFAMLGSFVALSIALALLVAIVVARL